MSYTTPILLTGDQIASVTSIGQVSNPGQPDFGMTLSGVTALGDPSATFRLVWHQNVNGSTEEFLNGQGWRLEAYTGSGDPATDTDLASWTQVPGYTNLSPRHDVVGGLGSGDEYIVFDAGGSYVLYNLNGDLPTTSTDLFYADTASTQNGDPAAGDNDGQLDFDDGYSAYQPVCFCTGTLIETSRGPLPVEQLTAGDLVQTLDHGLQPVRWIGRRDVSLAEIVAHPELRPIQISAGAMGTNTPARDLWLSPQHRVLVRSVIAQRMTGETEALVAVKHLCGTAGIRPATGRQPITYLHLRLDRHEVIRAEGLWAESLFIGREALKAMGPDARRELRLLFPGLVSDGADKAARMLLPGRIGQKLAERHLKNRKPLVAA